MSKEKLGLYDSCILNHTRTRDRAYMCPGSPLEKNYEMVVATKDDIEALEKDAKINGLKNVSDTLPEVGEWTILEKDPTNLYEKIQSYRESCDLRILLKKYENGDESALNQVVGDFVDVTDMPKNLAEVYAASMNAKSTFENLPLEVRKEYGHSPAAWFKAVSDGSFVEKFGKKDMSNKVDTKPVQSDIVDTKSTKGETVNE